MSYILDALARSHTARAEVGLRRLSKRSLWQQVAIGSLLVLVVAMAVAYPGDLKKPRATAVEELAVAPPTPHASSEVAEVPSMATRLARHASPPSQSAPALTATTRPASQATIAGAGTKIVAAPLSSTQLPTRSVERAAPRFRPPNTLSQPLPNPSPEGPGGIYETIRPPPAAPSLVTPTVAAVKPGTLALSDIKSTSALPPQVRSALEQLKVKVLFHTPQRRNRFVMIDNREVREGDELLEGLRLDEITDTGLVVKHKDILVRVPALASR